MSQKEDSYSDDDLHLHAGYIVVTALVVALLVLVAYLWRFGGMPISDQTGSWGEFGDYFGGVMNPIIGLATVFLVFITFTLQRRELRASLAELKRSNQSAAVQSFEQSLFAWLGNYHSLVGAIEWNDTAGRAALRTMFSNWIRADFRADRGDYATDAARIEGFEVILERALEQHEDIFSENRSSLDAPLRTLFRLVSWIDEHKDLNLREKWHYVALVRAQLSWIELIFLFYNALGPRGEKFAKLYNKYAILDNLAVGADPLIDEAAIIVARIHDGEINDPIPSLKALKPTAFASLLARRALGLPEG
ncbi:putative phage abortive infection protein [Variovorax sp. WS11]|uniref:putative phage abortive infection protein n=1 Tax=Variovorax sp. WS11 TaxID=1105204 RepID=UPI0013DC135C|nr:putative phage abortive infection protein [Variovorax sp. WS11]NDZ12061.1 hypothetical protein [Variovorax sp. WS11]